MQVMDEMCNPTFLLTHIAHNSAINFLFVVCFLLPSAFNDTSRKFCGKKNILSSSPPPHPQQQLMAVGMSGQAANKVLLFQTFFSPGTHSTKKGNRRLTDSPQPDVLKLTRVSTYVQKFTAEGYLWLCGCTQAHLFLHYIPLSLLCSFSSCTR